MAYKRSTRFKRRSRKFRSSHRRTTHNKSRGGRRTAAYTAQTTTAPRFGFRGRRLGRRTYKRILFNNTIAKAHYRAIHNLAVIHGTTLGIGGGIVTAYNVLNHGAPFFLSPNVSPIDGTTAPPAAWNGNVFIRGGQFSVTISILPSVVDVLKVKVWLVWSIASPDAGVIPLGAQSDAWDPSVNSDFQAFGRVTDFRETLLTGSNTSVEMLWRLPAMDVDQGIFTVGGKLPYLFIQISNQTSATVAVATVLRRYNLSFSADGI
jgi:hypothetical protein